MSGEQVQSNGELPEWHVDGEIVSPRDLAALAGAENTTEDEAKHHNEKLEKRVAELERELQTLRQYVADLDDRTDLLQFLDGADDADAEQRYAAIIQHMWRMVKDDPPAERRYAMNHEKVNEILHNPQVDRTTINRWMREAPRMVGDKRVCWYEGGDPGPGGEDAQIYLDLTGDGELPDGVFQPGTSNDGR